MKALMLNAYHLKTLTGYNNIFEKIRLSVLVKKHLSPNLYKNVLLPSYTSQCKDYFIVLIPDEYSSLVNFNVGLSFKFFRISLRFNPIINELIKIQKPLTSFNFQSYIYTCTNSDEVIITEPFFSDSTIFEEFKEVVELECKRLNLSCEFHNV